MKVDILGVKIDNVTIDEAVARVESMLADGKKHQVVTPNPEFVMLAQKDEEFRQILNQADLAIPDGAGLIWASRILGNSKLIRQLADQPPKFLKERVTGTDLMLGLCEHAAKKSWTVFLLGGKDGVAARAAEVLGRKFPGISIVGVSEADPGVSAANSPTRRVENFKPDGFFLGGVEKMGGMIDLLFVAYGAPIQEKWIVKNLPGIPVKVAMGVGGAFDFVVGKQKRASVFVRNLGLEWLWRLLTQPWRARRQLALLKFVMLIFWQRLK